MFSELINRSVQMTEWSKIPWDDPDFSRRMLAEHLSQANDAASRRQTIIDTHVDWIHRKVLKGQTANILNLGCGPGFYTKRLTDLGHTCTGVDFSPASIEYAGEQHPDGNYILGDVRELYFGSDYDLISMIYGELNAFSSDETQQIIDKAHEALKPGGKLLLEVHRYTFIHKLGQEPPSWHTAASGLFADEPYLCLIEHSFDLDHVISHYYVYLAHSGEMQHYVSMHQAYTDDEYRYLLDAFKRVTFYPSLTGGGTGSDLFVIVAEK